jgi:hypothetical protein
MRVQVAPGSKAAKAYYAALSLPGLAWPMPKAIAPGIKSAPLHDLIFHGGKTIEQMGFQNIYLGMASDWTPSDVTNIDAASLAAMQDNELNNVMLQYFPGSASLACTQRPSIFSATPKPARLDEPDVQAAVQTLLIQKKIDASDLDSTIFNLLLPPGIILALGNADSQSGLGGYHGSIHVGNGGSNVTLYYSANVYSQGANGIPVFDAPWKNVVGTLYHEMNEFRTDADVSDAIQNQNNDFLGWMSREGEECGDQPIVAAGANLQRIFRQVQTDEGATTYVQFLYSNAVHGAEGPVAQAH